MKVNVFAMRCITNLHVGNGDVNYNIIDQEVEKDPVNGLPMINASGVKGALREFFESDSAWGKENERVKSIFGSGNNDTAQGTYKFLQADILFRPLRVSDESNRSYVLSTTDEILQVFSTKVNSLGRNLKAENGEIYEDTGEKVSVEGEEAYSLKKAKDPWKKIVDKEFIVVKNLKKYDLPVIARNSLDDNGISQNLWYEEFVPHESVFGLIILSPGDMDEDFKSKLTSGPVQFGGNASIGYGLMEIKEA